MFKKGAFSAILREKMSKDADVQPWRFVLTIKPTEDGTIKYKARFVMGGKRGKQEHLAVHESSPLQP